MPVIFPANRWPNAASTAQLRSLSEFKGHAMRLKSAVTIIIAGIAIAGCNRSLNSIAPTSQNPQQLPSAPVQPVDAGVLPPAIDQSQTANGVDPMMQDPNAPQTAPVSPALEPEPQVAAVEQPVNSGEPVTREAVSGAWIVQSDNPQCRMILAFTKWAGGYRAATKRCNSAELASVSAWDVKGAQLVLMDGAGNTIARLYHSGGERYDGTTNSGQAVSFTR